MNDCASFGVTYIRLRVIFTVKNIRTVLHDTIITTHKSDNTCSFTLFVVQTRYMMDWDWWKIGGDCCCIGFMMMFIAACTWITIKYAINAKYWRFWQNSCWFLYLHESLRELDALYVYVWLVCVLRWNFLCLFVESSRYATHTAWVSCKHIQHCSLIFEKGSYQKRKKEGIGGNNETIKCIELAKFENAAWF